MDKTKKRILLLTLGTGPLDEEKKQAGYHNTQYMIDGRYYQKNGQNTETNFVAEPIIDYFCPDVIVFLGTVKSVWHQFYASAITANNDDTSYLQNENYQRLLFIEQENNMHTSSEQLIQYGNEITEIYSKIDSWDKYNEHYRSRRPQVHVLLTKYGINEDELIENYSIIKRLESYLDSRYRYEAAFDITHSFRSLPIYNLIIFNYIKNITSHDITIKHIYYGNTEVKRETGTYAPVVDLADLSRVLELTSAVAEFKDTGNAVSLLKMIDDDDSLKKTLGQFDLATQLNAFHQIRDGLNSLMEIIEDSAEDDRYTGVREMIRTVLGEKFFAGGERDVRAISDTDLKFMLTQWFFNQNRIGLGLATGLEALRDVNTPAFMKARGLQAGNDRKYRESAESYFIDRANTERLFHETESPLEQAAYRLGSNLRHYKDIRNMFAHSLKNETPDMNSISSDVETFWKDLCRIKELHDADSDSYLDLFRANHTPSTSGRRLRQCRIFITSNSNDWIYGDYKRSSKKKYDIYCLDPKIKAAVFGNVNDKNYMVSDKAAGLAIYLRNQLTGQTLKDYASIQVILDFRENLTSDARYRAEIELIFRIYFETIIETDRIQVSHIIEKEIKPYKKTKIQIMVPEEESVIGHGGWIENMGIHLKRIV